MEVFNAQYLVHAHAATRDTHAITMMVMMHHHALLLAILHAQAYEHLGCIGEGTYGVVLKCRDRRSGALVAIKRFKDSEHDDQARPTTPLRSHTPTQVKKTAMREVHILRSLNHQHIVRLIGVFRRKNKLHMVFEYVQHTLLELMERHPRGMPTPLVKTLLWQLLEAVAYLHTRKVTVGPSWCTLHMVSVVTTTQHCTARHSARQRISMRVTNMLTTGDPPRHQAGKHPRQCRQHPQAV